MRKIFLLSIGLIIICAQELKAQMADREETANYGDLDSSGGQYKGGTREILERLDRQLDRRGRRARALERQSDDYLRI